MRKLFLCTLCAVSALYAAAEGYQINTLSAKQLGMAHTGVALKLGAESMIFNPAGLGFSNKTLDISGSFTGIKAIAKATHNGATYKTDNGISTPIAFNAAFRVYDNVQVGVSFYTPYGSSIDWTKNWPGAVLNQNVDLKVYTIQPTVSWRITPKLSVGAGLTIGWGSVNLNKSLVSPSTLDAILTLTGSEYKFGHTSPASVNLKGESQVALGANIGAMYQISENVTIGASFRTKMKMKVKSGDASVEYANDIAKGILEKDLDIIHSANFAASMPCPYVFTFGASWKPVSKLTLAADAQLTGWKTYKTLEIDFLDERLETYDQKLIKDYSNAWCFRLGAEYAVTNRLDARLGLMIDTTPVNKKHYNPETPGMTKIGPAAGISFRPIPSLSIDFSFMYVAGTGAKNAECSYDDLLAAKMPMLQLPAKATFTADYKVHAFTPSIGLSYSF
ncbi:MAG: outer membrane protein transport protein [Paramuribaculum sp.]|nr:outer membrane protein transport protein [Paramuribaculum sp.]